MLCRHCARLLRPHPPPSTSLLSLRTLTTLPSSPPTAQPFSTPFTPSPTSNSSLPSSTPTKHKTPDSTPKSSTKAGTVLKGLAYLKGQDPPIAREDAEYPPWLWGLLEGRENAKGGEGEEEGDLFGRWIFWFCAVCGGGGKGDGGNEGWGWGRGSRREEGEESEGRGRGFLGGYEANIWRTTAKSKKQRRIAAKASRKQAASDPGSLVPKVPLVCSVFSFYSSPPLSSHPHPSPTPSISSPTPHPSIHPPRNPPRHSPPPSIPPHTLISPPPLGTPIHRPPLRPTPPLRYHRERTTAGSQGSAGRAHERDAEGEEKGY
jgi:hypothetical protein